MTERLHFHFSLSCIGEGNGDPLQCSCLENPRDGGAWWAAVYGAAQSRTRLKWLSSSSSGLHYSSTSVGWLCCTGSGLGGWGSGPKLGSQTHWTWLETLRAVFPNSPLVSTTCCVPSLFLWPSWRAPPVWDAMWHLFNAAPAADTQPGVLMIQPGVLSPRDPQTTNLGGGWPGRTGVLWSPWWTWAPGRNSLISYNSPSHLHCYSHTSLLFFEAGGHTSASFPCPWNGAQPYGSCPVSSACLSSMENLNQRISLSEKWETQKQRKTVKGDQIITM